MFARLPLALMLLGLALIVTGIGDLFGLGWALIAAGVGLVALAVNEAS